VTFVFFVAYVSTFVTVVAPLRRRNVARFFFVVRIHLERPGSLAGAQVATKITEDGEATKDTMITKEGEATKGTMITKEGEATKGTMTTKF